MNLRVYYEDTDAGGVVYNGRYLGFFERARTEFLREKGIDLKKLMDEGIVFVVRDLAMRFHRPARYGDLLEVATTIVKVGGASIDIAHEIHRDGELLVSGTTDMACIKDGKPCKLPSEVRAALV